MNKIIALIGMSLGGWVGWVVGAWISLGVAFVLSLVGSAFGLYFSRRLASEYLP